MVTARRSNGIVDDFGTWRDAIEVFFKEHPGLAADNSRGYVRFLQERGALDKDAADRLCQGFKEKTICKPEVFVRVRRLLGEMGLLPVTDVQQSFLDEAEIDSRRHFRDNKKNNPVWDH